MGPKKTKSDILGKAIIKEKNKRRNIRPHTMLHTSEINDGSDWSRLNAQSITDQSNVEELLAIAELAGRDFKAEKMNVKIINSTSQLGILSKAEKEKIKRVQEENKSMLRIPRRPAWDRTMIKEELLKAENDAFYTWRRNLSQLKEVEGITMTPYEKNLEFWRQLWRVAERSDVVVQIVDARNPLLFFCQDLCDYVNELDSSKENLLLVNKSDFLTTDQRISWCEYFEKNNIKAVFFSALLEEDIESDNEEEICPSISSIAEDDETESSSEDEDSSPSPKEEEPLNSPHKKEEEIENLNSFITPDDINHLNMLSLSAHHDELENRKENIYINSPDLLDNDQLIELFSSYSPHPLSNNKHTTIGLVGYPNVGKSSTINSMFQSKKVSVSTTPGKTKHFQTLFLNEKLLLCDCPGLVFPAFVSSREEMVISGILPIDQMRDHVPPMNLMLTLIPRNILELTYGISIPLPPLNEEQDRVPNSEEFINAYGCMRGYMTQRGISDHPRSARYVLKDYIIGKLLYCHAPPEKDQQVYHDFIVLKPKRPNTDPTPQQKSAMMQRRTTEEKLDREFFGSYGIHHKGKRLTKENVIIIGTDGKADKVKPDRNKKQKARIRFKHLDEDQ